MFNFKERGIGSTGNIFQVNIEWMLPLLKMINTLTCTFDSDDILINDKLIIYINFPHVTK